jgi:nucleotide-binding universal stress UspA family protein
MYKRILVPLDGSDVAEVALPYAEELAEKLDSELTVINIRGPGEDPDNPEHRAYLSKIVATVEQNIKKSGGIKPGQKIKVDSAIVGGHGILIHAAEEILDYAERENISLIVMASHGRTGIRRWALGSTADKVIRAAKYPVMVIRANLNIPGTIKLSKLLVTLDESKESETVLPHIESLASKLNAMVTLLHVVVPPYHIYPISGGIGYYGGEGIVKVPYSDAEVKPLKERAREYLQKVSDKLKDKGIRTNLEVRTGSAADEIIEAAQELGIDLVAMATHGESGLSRWEYGSIADKVLRAGSTPLLLVRER